MKKVILFIALVFAAQASMGQRTAYHEQPEKLFNQGKEMFLEGNYTGAQDQLLKFSAESNEDNQKVGAADMAAVSLFNLGNESRVASYEVSICTYPRTVCRHEFIFLIGCLRIAQK